MAKSAISFVFIVIQALVGMATSTCTNPIEMVGGGDQTVDILCAGGVLPSTASWMHNNIMINIDGVKYTTTRNGGRLTVHSVTGSDEGSYSCYYEVNQGQTQTDDSSCLHVLGRAVFTTCGNTQVCREEVDLVIGRPLFFDTRLSYLDAGNSNMRQTTSELFLRKGGTNYAVCSNTTGTQCTTSQDHLTFSIGSHLFDVNITLNSTTLEDVGDYTAVVDVRNYTSGSVVQITKTFATILKCSILQNPVNGQVTVNADGNHAIYSCDEPYILVGNSTRRCSSNGSWSGVEPTCATTSPTITTTSRSGPPISTLQPSTTGKPEPSATGTPIPTPIPSTTDMPETTTPGSVAVEFPVVAVTVSVVLVASAAGVILTAVIVVMFLIHRKHLDKSDGDPEVKPLRFSRMSSLTSNTSEQLRTPDNGYGKVIGTELEQAQDRDSVIWEGNDASKFEFDGPSNNI